MKRLLPLLAALALSACATVPAAPSPTPTAGLGETATVGPLFVRPTMVIEDSRCPADVQCVWAGRLTVRIVATYAGADEEIHLGVTLGESASLFGGRLTLQSATPDKISAAAIPTNRYRFTFIFQR